MGDDLVLHDEDFSSGERDRRGSFRRLFQLRHFECVIHDGEQMLLRVPYLGLVFAEDFRVGGFLVDFAETENDVERRAKCRNRRRECSDRG